MDSAAKEIFDLYYKDVYSYLYSLCRDVLLAEDLASETFLQAVCSLAAFRGESEVKTWLFTIARRRWIAHLRRRKRQAGTQALFGLPESGAGPEEAYMDRALASRIEELLRAQPPRTQGIVAMRLEGYSFYEIAAKFGISESSARVIDFRAKEKIRKILREEGLYDV